jgi:hypothetical protein
MSRAARPRICPTCLLCHEPRHDGATCEYAKGYRAAVVDVGHRFSKVADEPGEGCVFALWLYGMRSRGSVTP